MNMVGSGSVGCASSCHRAARGGSVGREPVGGRSKPPLFKCKRNTTMVGVRTREGRRISNETDLAHMHFAPHE